MGHSRQLIHAITSNRDVFRLQMLSGKAKAVVFQPESGHRLHYRRN